MAKIIAFICSLRAALRKSTQANRQLRERTDSHDRVLYRDGFVYVHLTEDFSFDSEVLQIYEIEYVGWEKPRRYIEIPAARD